MRLPLAARTAPRTPAARSLSIQCGASSLEPRALSVERRASSAQPAATRACLCSCSSCSCPVALQAPTSHTTLSGNIVFKNETAAQRAWPFPAGDRPTTARPNPQTLNARWLSSPPALRPPGAQTLADSSPSTPPQASPQAQREHPVLQPRTPPTPTALLFFLPFLEGQGLGPQDHPGHSQSPGPGAGTHTLTHRDPTLEPNAQADWDWLAVLALQKSCSGQASLLESTDPHPAPPDHLCALLCWVCLHLEKHGPTTWAPGCLLTTDTPFSCFSLLATSLRVLTRCCHWAWQDARCLQPAGICLLPDGRSLGTESCGSTGRGRLVLEMLLLR